MAVSRLRKAARVILVGAPGVGKGTQAERLMKQYPQVSAVSSGDLLRASVRNKTPLGMTMVQADSCIAALPMSTECVIRLTSREYHENW